MTNRFRLEPSIGLFSISSSSTTTPTTQGIGSPSTTSTDASLTIIGIRGTYSSSLSNSLALYYGPRLEFGIVSLTEEYVYTTSYPVANTRQDDKTTTKETDITFGGVIGVEYFPICKFSVGGEISLNYVTFGNPDIEDYPTPASLPTYTTERKQQILYTDALFFLRWYFL